jgi:LysM repeat protein
MGANQVDYGAEKQLHNQVKTMQYTIANQDSEIAYIKEKLASFETVLDSTHDEMAKLIAQAKSAVKKSSGTVETRVQAIEKNSEKIVSDLKTFKKQTNDLSKLLGELQTSLKEKEELLSLQAEQMKELEQAMRLLAQALQAKSTATTTSGTYQVKPGDTLDKIAKELNTTVASIKAENNLQKDIIHPGQKLKIP